MNGGFLVQADAVQAHAAEVADIASRVQLAAEAGQATRAIDGEAYGQIGQVFAVQAKAAVEAAIRCLSSAADAGQAMATELGATAVSYRHAERANTELLGGGQ